MAMTPRRHPTTPDVDTVLAEMGFPSGSASQSEAVVYSVVRTADLLVWQLAPIYKRAGLTAASFNLLMLLKHGRDTHSLTQHTIGQRLVASPSDISGLIDRLERKGLVRRAPGQDRRSNRLTITPRGTELIDKVWDQHVQTVEALAAPLSRTDAAHLLHVLTRLRQGMAR